MSTFNVKTIRPVHTFNKHSGPKRKKNNFLGKVIFLAVLLIVFFILFTQILPKVNVFIEPKTTEFKKDFEIQLSTEKQSAEDLIFKAEKISTEQKIKDSFEATGEKDVGDKAEGIAFFYNSTGRSQPITQNIELININGIVFNATEDFVIPGAKVDDDGNIVDGQIEIKIQAKEPGEKGNVSSGRINISALDIDKQSKIYGQIQNETIGGTSKKVTVISQDDIDNAKENLFSQAEGKILEKLKKLTKDEIHISEKLIIYDDSEINSSFEVDEEVEKFDLELNLKATALGYNNKELRLFLKDQILNELPEGQTIPETDFGDLNIEIQNFDKDLGIANLNIETTFNVAEQIDSETIMENILNKNQKDARRYILSLPNIKNVRFDFSLTITNKIPSNSNRVKIILGE
jgi:hypothetical protein